jgi:hypothetical protein
MLGQGAEVGMPDSSRAMTSKGHKMVKKSNRAALQASQIMQLSLNRQRSHKHYKNDQSEGSSQQWKHKMKPSGKCGLVLVLLAGNCILRELLCSMYECILSEDAYAPIGSRSWTEKY